MAAQNNKEACVERLINAKANVREKNNLNWQLLHFIARSAQKNHWLDFKYCEPYYSKDIKEADSKGNTPVHHAAYKGNIEFLKKVRKKFEKETKKTFNIANDQNGKPLHMAIQGDKAYCLQTLIEFTGINKEERSELFLYAAAHGKPECLEKLYDTGVNIKKDQRGMTSLHYIVKDDCWINENTPNQERQGYKKCLELLLDFKDDKEEFININLANHENKTPFHLAAEAGNIECLATLLDQQQKGNRVNLDAEDKNSKKPEKLAKGICKKALDEAREILNDENWSNLSLNYFRDKYKEHFKTQVIQANSQNQHTHNGSETITIPYQEKLFTNDEDVIPIEFKNKYKSIIYHKNKTIFFKK